jgi:hypothetical protein
MLVKKLLLLSNEVRTKKISHFGYNAREDKFEDLVKAGIIDPTKVTRSAVSGLMLNAASMGFRNGLMLTTETMIAERSSLRGDLRKFIISLKLISYLEMTQNFSKNLHVLDNYKVVEKLKNYKDSNEERERYAFCLSLK